MGAPGLYGARRAAARHAATCVTPPHVACRPALAELVPHVAGRLLLEELLRGGQQRNSSAAAGRQRADSRGSRLSSLDMLSSYMVMVVVLGVSKMMVTQVACIGCAAQENAPIHTMAELQQRLVTQPIGFARVPS
jgi:hypothetical protein